MKSEDLAAVLWAPPWYTAIVAQHSTRYFRKVLQTALRWYFELEGGVIQTDTGPVFDERVLNYRIDVELALKPFTEQERKAIFLIHRDGLTQVQALSLAGIATERPDKTVDDIESRMGRALDRRRLAEFLQYIEYLI
jgi:hypothetical protein